MSHKPAFFGLMANITAITSSLGEVLLPPQRVQFAALPWRIRKKKLEVLLVTSDSGRWIVPKGWPQKDGDAWATAAEEAWEEAGVRGEVSLEPVGEFTYEKWHDAGYPVDCRVVVYAMQVSEVAEDYPEAKKRRRKWLPVDEAIREAGLPGLDALLTAFATTKSAGKRAKS